MSKERIFSGIVQQASYSITDNIDDALAFYIIAPDDTVDVQIDVYLQLEINLLENRQIRLYEGITENDTRTALTIPKEYQYINIPKKFALYSDFRVSIEVWCIYQNKSVDTDRMVAIQEKLNQLQLQQTAETALTAGIAVNAIQQNVGLGLLAASLAPITLGTSLTTEPPLISGTTTLSSALLLLTGG